MTKIKSALLATLLAIFLPVAASADLIRYSFVGADGGDGWTSSGSFTFEDPDLVAGGDIAGSLVSWVFRWTDGTDSARVGSSSGSLEFFLFEIAAGGSVDTADACTFPCFGVPDGFDDFAVIFDGIFDFSNWIGELDTLDCCQGGLEHSTVRFSGPKRVPEPGTLALLGLGLAGLGFARRRRQA